VAGFALKAWGSSPIRAWLDADATLVECLDRRLSDSLSSWVLEKKRFWKVAEIAPSYLLAFDPEAPGSLTARSGRSLGSFFFIPKSEAPSPVDTPL
jgi:hypothetical protein